MRNIRMVLVLLLSLTAMAMSADNKKNTGELPKDRLKKECKVYISSLNLKGDTAERFSKIFMDYKTDIHKALEGNRTKLEEINKKGPRITEKEVDANIRARFKLSRSLLDIREKYYGRFRQVLTPSEYEVFTILEQRFDQRKVREHQRRNTVTDKNKRRMDAEYERHKKMLEKSKQRMELDRQKKQVSTRPE